MPNTILTKDDEVFPGGGEDSKVRLTPYFSTFRWWWFARWPSKLLRALIVVGGHIFKNVLDVLGGHLVTIPHLAASFTVE